MITFYWLVNFIPSAIYAVKGMRIVFSGFHRLIAAETVFNLYSCGFQKFNSRKEQFTSSFYLYQPIK
jgi:hypothetical protein